MDHGAEHSEAPLGSSGEVRRRAPQNKPWTWWARVCIDVSDRSETLGYSVEVHDGEHLESIHVFPCGPFDDPVEVFADALVWLRETYGEQLALTLF